VVASARPPLPGRRPVLFTAAIDNGLKREIDRYLKRGLLIVDEFGHLPIDGADLLFEITSRRYECAPMVITTNSVTCAAAPRPEWTSVFNAPLRRQGRDRLDGRVS
jgi:hypothetical protein